MNKYINLKCQNCGATMQVDADKHIKYCPYCGSAELIEESDDVKKTRIRETEVTKRHKDDIDAKADEQRWNDKMVLVSLGFMLLLILLVFTQI